MSDMSEPILATVTPSPARRVFGVGLLAVLGGLLIFLGLDTGGRAIGASVVLLSTGAFALWAAESVRRASAVSLEVTASELRDSTGRVLTPLSDIVRVERGAFAFKPSNGFLLHVRNKGPRHWAPGLWWRLGRRIGVGGVTSAAEAKFMAETIALHLAQTDSAAPR